VVLLLFRQLFVFISLILVLQAANANENIGKISELKGNGEIVRDDKYQAEIEFGIFSMDDVRTGNGRIKIDFVDGSELRITEQSKITIDEFVYDANPDNGKLAVSFLSGTARFATSKSKKIKNENVSIKTPTAQIAVRGTDFTVTVDEMGKSMVILLPDEYGLPSGEILVSTGAGTVVLNRSYQSTVAYLYDSSPTKPVILDLTLDMIDNMLIVNPPKQVKEEIEEEVLATDALTFNDLNIDLLEFKEEKQEIEFNRLDVDYLGIDLLSDIMDTLVEIDGLREKKEEGIRASTDIEGTAMGFDQKTGLITFVEGGIVNMSRDNNGKIQLYLDSSTSYNIIFNVDNRTFNVLVNGGESNVIKIRQSK
jgi:hypothetical protein